MTTMDHPIQRGSTGLAWAPDGYRLTVTAWLDERASALFERRIPEALGSLVELADEAVGHEFRGGQGWHDAERSDSEAALLAIIAPGTLFAVEPQK